MRNRFKYADRTIQVDVISRHPLKVSLTEEDDTKDLVIDQELSQGEGRILLDGAYKPYFVTDSPNGVWVTLAGRTFFFEKAVQHAGEDDHHLGFSAPMPGKVTGVFVADGDNVEKGQVLVIMEAMKMEHRIEAPAAGVVTGLHCKAEDLVDQGFVLLDFEAAED